MDQVIITTGANELPVYVAAKYWRERCPEAGWTLFCSDETRDEAQRVLNLLEPGGPPNSHRVCCGRPYDADEIERAAAGVPGERCVVDFTGGTKVMSFHLMKALGGRVVKTSYLDAKIHAVRCAGELTHSGDLRRRTGYDLTFEQLRKLHGAKWTREGGPAASSVLLTQAAEYLKAALSGNLNGLSWHQDASPLAVVLGYQLLTVTALDGPVSRADQKLAAFKALHRTRQAGGDHAHAVVVTKVPARQNADVSHDVAIDIGGTSPNLHCWTTQDRNRDLQQHFSRLLKDLNWI